MVVNDDIETIREVYIQWLYGIVGLNDPRYAHYWRIIRRLFRKEFYILVRNDQNRYKDGMLLRMRFCDEYGYSVSVVENALNFNCSVLEMLVALAERVDSEVMWDPDVGNRTAFWFWTMIWNLGIDPKKFSDEYFDKECLISLEEKLNVAVSRRYRKDGAGGFFPLKRAHKNLQKVELWYQMQFWIEENYPI